jgi:hypothetical protein
MLFLMPIFFWLPATAAIIREEDFPINGEPLQLSIFMILIMLGAAQVLQPMAICFMMEIAVKIIPVVSLKALMSLLSEVSRGNGVKLPNSNLFLKICLMTTTGCF